MISFTDGAARGDSLTFRPPPAIITRRPRMLVFCDGASGRTSRPRFIDGYSVVSTNPHFSRACAPFGPTVQPYTRVQVNPEHVACAIEHTYRGQAGYILEGPTGFPLAWVHAVDWLEAVGW